MEMINIDESQKIMKEYSQFKDQKITYLNLNQNNTNEIKNTLTDKPLIQSKRE